MCAMGRSAYAFRFQEFFSCKGASEGYCQPPELAFVEPAYYSEESMSINDSSKKPDFIGFFAHFKKSSRKSPRDSEKPTF